MNKRYQWLLFDADGTLFDYDRAEATALEQSFRQAGAPFEPRYLALYRQINHQLWQALERREMSPAVLRVRRFELLFEALQVELPPAAFSASYLQHFGACAELMEGAVELLHGLQGKYRLAIITNGLQDVQRSRLACSAIGEYIAELIISEEVGYAKPHQAIFDAALARLGHPAKSEVLMIGDSLTSDMQGGCDYGLDTCWYNPAGHPRPPHLPLTYEISHLSQLMELLG
ncbi:MAG: YjjG family noncanonical pyrimidine nucleotidase [Chloroflexi bacterium]|nr:YjjG family noncanonical pyrimidine nucleotidase [Chloroflexota bacterium]MCI0577715.1 YjjG family noncanonical pyrimidine nucleotidase [Chloroflexota bacterium]MCI0649798.1 YjjG family noncanonical pyrimidine nucleotidase [Chloroflexota bacterium]MCI0730507.1 YjjG family noncanonical pyrimidine nucleotidase [Chloroflexota bacterium]